jgi:hypothetical protein
MDLPVNSRISQIARCKDTGVSKLMRNYLPGYQKDTEAKEETRPRSKSHRELAGELGLHPRSAGACLILLPAFDLKYSEGK